MRAVAGLLAGMAIGFLPNGFPAVAAAKHHHHGHHKHHHAKKRHRKRHRAASLHPAPKTGPSIPLHGGPVVTISTPVLDVSNTPGHAEGEPTLAYNPTNPSNIVLGSNQWQPLLQSTNPDYIGLGPSGFTRCAAWASLDAGKSWSGGAMIDGGLGPVQVPFQVPNVPGEFDDPGNVFSADQNTVFDRHGTAWYDCINFGVTTGVERLDVWRSDDGGQHFYNIGSAFSQATDTNRQMDRPFLALDQSGGPNDGTLYMAWETIFYDPSVPELFVRASRDGGRSWGPIVRIDSNAAYASMWDARLFPMVGADGSLYVIYDSGNVTPFDYFPQRDKPSLVLAVSHDGGKTFSYHWVAQKVDRPDPPDEDEIELTEFISSMATDPRRAGRVAVAWPAMVNNKSRILLRSSRDGGQTWTAPLDVADDNPDAYFPPDNFPPNSSTGLQYPAGNGNEHDHVMLRYLPDGRLVVVWRDRRYAGGAWSKPWDVFARVVSIGADGSLHPGVTVRVTPASEPTTTFHRGHMPSEYLAMTPLPDGSGVGVAWDAMRGPNFPDDVYRFVPIGAFGG
jgi:hypothetical protein